MNLPTGYDGHVPAGEEFHAGAHRSLLLPGELPLEAGRGDVTTGLFVEAAGRQRVGPDLRNATAQHAAAQEHSARPRRQLLPSRGTQKRRQYTSPSTYHPIQKLVANIYIQCKQLAN